MLKPSRMNSLTSQIGFGLKKAMDIATPVVGIQPSEACNAGQRFRRKHSTQVDMQTRLATGLHHFPYEERLHQLGHNYQQWL